MIRYAELGRNKVADALALVADYFTLAWGDFLRRYFANRKEMLERATTEASWHRIRDGLSALQAKLVTEQRPANRLVLAGPGSGKTRLVVHRVAFLVRVLREPPRSILVVTFNRHAAQEVRRRLRELIDDDAAGVAAYTYHGLALRLTGTSLAAPDAAAAIDFDAVLNDATKLLQNGVADDGEAEPDALRERLLAGFRWLLVDEYQDINAAQYAFLSALAGRTLEDKARKLTLLAVGDDDQNIYEFAGAEVQFIRRFEEDYQTKTDYLVENFRSSRHVIDAANALIKRHPGRLKETHSIVIDSARRKAPAGGPWKERDAALAAGRVQILPGGADEPEQGWRALHELRRFAALDDAWDWSRVAVIARNWETLHPVRAACELAGIPCRFTGRRQKGLAPWRWREVWHFVEAVKARRGELLPAAELRALAASLRKSDPATPGHALVEALIDDAYADAGDFSRPGEAVLEDAFEFLADVGRDSGTGLALTTAHGAKGLEFDHVVVLDGGWETSVLAERRLYYVAMTRARQTLTLCRLGPNGFADELANQPAVLARASALATRLPDGLDRRYELLGVKDVDLGFAARSRSDAVREALAKLHAGDALTVVAEAGRWLFKTAAGKIVGRSARAYTLPAGRIVCARVAAIGVWRREDGDDGWRDRAVVDRWEFVLPEVVLEPEAGAHQVSSPAVQRA